MIELVDIKNKCAEYGIDADTDRCRVFSQFCDMLVKANETTNLTAVTDPSEMITRHIIDSIILCRYAELKNKSIIDIGSGAGFPGIPLKIYEPSVSLVSVDAVGKKLDFQRSAADALGLENVEIIHGRAEDLGHEEELRESFDTCTMRAVSSMPVIMEYALPFVKVNGIFAAYKAQISDDELNDAERAASLLGGEIEKVNRYKIEGAERSLLIIRKVSPAPSKYPRNPGRIKKNPL